MRTPQEYEAICNGIGKTFQVSSALSSLCDIDDEKTTTDTYFGLKALKELNVIADQNHRAVIDLIVGKGNVEYGDIKIMKQIFGSQLNEYQEQLVDLGQENLAATDRIIRG